MFRTVHALLGRTVMALDGEAGQVDDVYFDDFRWVVRYLVVETGEPLGSRGVLIVPSAVQNLIGQDQSLQINLTREKIKNSPGIETDRPVSRQNEVDLHNYYGWPYYWGPDWVPGIGLGTGMIPPVMPEPVEEQEPEEEEDRHLLSFREVHGYQIAARDGDIGRLDDLITEDETWNLLYMVVDAGGWLSGRKVLVSPSWVEKIDWSDSRVHVDLSQETVRHSPPYDPRVPLERGYEEQLYRHYGREGYWRRR